MIVKLDTRLFTENDQGQYGLLDALFLFWDDNNGRHKYYLRIDNEQVLYESPFFEGESGRGPDRAKNFLKRNLKVNSKVSSNKIRMTISLEEDVAQRKFRLPQALKILKTPLWVLVENDESDKAFMDCLLRVYRMEDGANLLGRFPGDWNYLFAGGSGNMRRKIGELKAQLPENALPLRLLVIRDSDLNGPRDIYNNDIQQLKTLCEEEEVTLHIHQKRAIENYLPLDQLKNEIPLPEENHARAEAYNQLSAQQQDYFNFKKGIRVGNRANEHQVSLYEGLDLRKGPMKALRDKGFSEASVEKIPFLFREGKITREMLDARLAHHPPDKRKELQELVEKFQKLL